MALNCCPAPMLRPPVHPDQDDAIISFLQLSFRAARLSRQFLERIGHMQVGKGMSSLVHLCIQHQVLLPAPCLGWGARASFSRVFPVWPLCSFRILVPWPGVKSASPTEGEPRPVPDPRDIPLLSVWEPFLWQMLGWAQTTGASGSGD